MAEMTLHGSPLRGLTDHDIEGRIERAMEQATDALRYGGPAHAQMYKDEVAKLAREQDRRRA